MKIIIAGAGDIGYHLAEMLSHEQQDITLIDRDEEVLDNAGQKLDVLTILGDASSPKVLKDSNIKNANLFIAVTTSEKTNLISCILAKKLGAGQGVARVNNTEYLSKEHKITFSELGVDALFSPRLLAAQEIQRLVRHPYFTDVFEFDDGLFSLGAITVEESCPVKNMTIAEIDQNHPGISFRPIAILRGYETVIARGPTRLKVGDHVYFLNPRGRLPELLELLNVRTPSLKHVMVLGGQDIGYLTAQLLEDTHSVKLIEENKSLCKELAENLGHTLILNGDPGNFDLLKEEDLQGMDCFIALTRSTEANILSSMMAQNLGLKKTISLVENTAYIRLSQNIGIDTLINKKLIAANHIFRFVRKGKISAITNLAGVDAEVIEFEIQKKNRITKHPIKDLHFPNDALIGGVVRNGKPYIPGGNFQLDIGDRVIVFAMPTAISKVEELFK